MTSDTTTAAADVKQMVIFDLASETYGVDIGLVREIIRMLEITCMPQTPDFVEGVINLRGKVIPVIDLRKRFGLEQQEHTKDTRVVVVEIGGQDVGVVVDAVAEVLRIPADSINPPSNVISSADSEYLLGIANLGEQLIILLDLERSLSALASAIVTGDYQMEQHSDSPVKHPTKASKTRTQDAVLELGT